MPIPVRQNGSSDSTCSITGMSDTVADKIAVSPRGEALSPDAPPANMSMINEGIILLVMIASTITRRGGSSPK